MATTFMPYPYTPLATSYCNRCEINAAVFEASGPDGCVEELLIGSSK